MQGAYSIYGKPKLVVLYEVDDNSEEDLNDLENNAIEVYDSVNNGLNINTKAVSGNGLQGEYHKNSKWTNDIIRKVFFDICKCTTSFKTIVETHGVSIDLVRDISKGKAHR